ncbi:MAG: universal stress protein [Deltaproteobacteria bacterium]|nr:universal stress protein [Deltaproteobacteria bacterium]
MGFKAILVATDFSECAGAAFKVAKSLARQFGAKIVLLHVIQQRIVSRVAEHLKVEPDSLLLAFREEAQQHLDEFLGKCCPDGLEVTGMVTVGIPFQEIAVIARDLAADLIVMGGYGRSGRGPIEEVFFGSTAEKVVRLLPCPVLCVPGESQAATAENPP